MAGLKMSNKFRKNNVRGGGGKRMSRMSKRTIKKGGQRISRMSKRTIKKSGQRMTRKTLKGGMFTSSVKKPAQGEIVESFVEVLYDYNPSDYKFSRLKSHPPTPQDLNIKKEQILKIFEPLDKPGYYTAETANGKKGVVPSNYVRPTTNSF